jgi:hypothetical protein
MGTRLAVVLLCALLAVPFAVAQGPLPDASEAATILGGASQRADLDGVRPAVPSLLAPLRQHERERGGPDPAVPADLPAVVAVAVAVAVACACSVPRKDGMEVLLDPRGPPLPGHRLHA